MQVSTVWSPKNENVENKIKSFMHRKAQQFPDLDLEHQAERGRLERTW